PGGRQGQAAVQVRGQTVDVARGQRHLANTRRVAPGDRQAFRESRASSRPGGAGREATRLAPALRARARLPGRRVPGVPVELHAQPEAGTPADQAILVANELVTLIHVEADAVALTPAVVARHRARACLGLGILQPGAELSHLRLAMIVERP